MVYGREALILGGILVAAVLANTATPKQEWRVERRFGDSGRVDFSVIRTRIGSWSQQENSVPVSNFRNFRQGSLNSGGPVKFEYVQDAGSLLCEGRMFLGKGSGTWTFQPNPEFVREFRELGYAIPDNEQLFWMTLNGVDLAFARGVKEAELRASTEDLLDMRRHGITVDLVREMRAAGYRGFTAGNYIDLRNHGVGAGYLKGLAEAGMENLSSDEITSLKNHGVRAELAQVSTDLGYRFRSQELIDLSTHGVTEEYLRNLRASGMTNLSAEQIVKLREHGVE